MRVPVRSALRRCLIRALAGLPGTLLASAGPALAGPIADLRRQVAQSGWALNQNPLLRYALIALLFLLAFSIARRFLWPMLQHRLGAGRITGQVGLVRQAWRYERARDYAAAGVCYEEMGATDQAFAAYAKGGCQREAAALHERLNQHAQAAQKYELAAEPALAAAVRERMGQFARAAGLYEKAGDLAAAAGCHARAGDFRKAATLMGRLDRLEEAAAFLERAGEVRGAAETLEKAVKRQGVAGRIELNSLVGDASTSFGLKRQQEAERHELNPERQAALVEMARRCAALYVKAGAPEPAAQILKIAGAEREAADCFAQAGKLREALDLYKKHRLFGKARKVAEALGALEEVELVRGEELLEEGRPAEAAAAFARGKGYYRAGELYAGLQEYEKAGEMFTLGGDLDQAAEMFGSGGDPARAGAAFERARRFGEAARFYRRAGATAKAAAAHRAAGEHFEAGMLLKEEGDLEAAVSTLQQVPATSEHFLEAAAALGQIFVETEMYGLAKEKLQEVVAATPLTTASLDIYYLLAVAQEKTGETQLARTLYEKVMAYHLNYRDVQARIAALREQRAPAHAQAVPRTGVDQPERYKIVRELGRGGMGIVYLAEDSLLKRPVAYKVLPAAIQASAKGVEEFLGEARIAASLLHPNIVTLYDAGDAGQGLYLVMEYVEGKTLLALLGQRPRFGLPEVLYIAQQVGSGLAHAHARGVVHGDITPANIMVSKTRAVKIMDFGLAKTRERALAATTTIRGTPPYMAPEQIQGKGMSAQSDLYALACTLYHMATGAPPFTEGEVLYHHLHTPAPSPSTRVPDLPEGFSRALQHCLEKEPAKRPQGIREFLAEILPRPAAAGR
ncbi:MAG TPA: serine/threonine-protein kinase [Candidatus Methylomirabilis sp.]|nr:serine/threonine-protein kinase [Candidatus Methylomirabilis sp.]